MACGVLRPPWGPYCPGQGKARLRRPWSAGEERSLQQEKAKKQEPYQSQDLCGVG